MDIDIFLQESSDIDFSSAIVREQAKKLFKKVGSRIEKVQIAFEFVRDKINHSIDSHAAHVTCKASDVLKYQTGISHAKANLLAALLRSQKIPAGLCYQRIAKTDGSKGHQVYCFNAVLVGNRWIKLDARGNNETVSTHFSLHEPSLAYASHNQSGNTVYPGIFAQPDVASRKALVSSKNLEELLASLPERLQSEPDILEIEAEELTDNTSGEDAESNWFWF